MTEKELLKKLNKLKNIEPNQEWRKNSREILLSQIFASQEISAEDKNASVQNNMFLLKAFFKDIMPNNLFVEIVKPVWVIILILIFVFCGSALSVYASRNAKPGDSLYIAKIISEKTQYAMTFDEKEKVKLNLQFAGNRAKEITQILSESAGKTEEKKQKVEKLAQNFKKEIDEVKTRLNINDNVTSATSVAAPKNEGDVQVFGANLGKDDKRLEIAIPKNTSSTGEQAIPDKNAKATSTSNGLKENDSSAADKVLNEAERLFDEKNYNGSINKLEQVNNIIDKNNSAITSSDNSGRVKGASDSQATTTGEY